MVCQLVQVLSVALQPQKLVTLQSTCFINGDKDSATTPARFHNIKSWYNYVVTSVLISVTVVLFHTSIIKPFCAF